MSEFIDRVAAAILDVEGVSWEDVKFKEWEAQQYRDMARAAIAVIRDHFANSLNESLHYAAEKLDKELV